jgi:hypothetical protein
MAETDSRVETQKAYFIEMILMLSSSAMHHLGKTISPISGKAELNLEAARATIDMVEMLEAKTRGNLDRDETRLLTNTLTSLRMNYVETASQPAKEDSKPEAKAEPTAPAAAKTEVPPEKDPKFHKTYG